ncbi:MAG: hypothetical protein AB7D06_18070 [Pedobacter sp.]
MNFDIFESIAGSNSVAVIAAAMLGLFISIVLIRILATINNQYGLVQKEDIKFKDFLWNSVMLFVFLIAVMAFVKSV